MRLSDGMDGIGRRSKYSSQPIRFSLQEQPNMKKGTGFQTIYSFILLGTLSGLLIVFFTVVIRFSLISNIGYILLLKERFDQAHSLFSTSVVTSTSPSFSTWNGLGLTEAAQGHYNNALLSLSNALEIDPTIDITRLKKAEVNLLIGREKDAFNDLTNSSFHSLKWMVNNALSTGNLDQAILISQAMTDAYPSEWESHYYLGVSQYHQGYTDQAIIHLTEGIKLAPENESILFFLGKTFYSDGDYYSSIDIFTRLIEVAPDDFLGWYWRGISYLQLKDYIRSEEDLIMAVKIKPTDINPHFHLAKIYMLYGEIEKSLEEYQAILKIDPDNREASTQIIRLEGIKE